MAKLTREQFENLLTNQNVVAEFESLTKEQLTEMLGSDVAEMVGFEQKNCHHCYNLYMHTLKAVESIEPKGLTPEQFTMLRVAAFFHDVAKPKVSSFNPKTNQQVFYGHAEKSVEVATPILASLGYSEEEVKRLGFLIGHHDDFISYRTELKPFEFNHLFIRKITAETIAEKMIENTYDFKAMGYTEEEIKGILFCLTQNKPPFFKTKTGNYQFNVDINEVKAKMASGQFTKPFIPTIADYQLLVEICKADSLSQSDFAIQDGKVVGSKKEKMQRNELIESLLPKAYEIFNGLNYSKNK